MAQIIKGDDLMLFDDKGASIAFATSHQLTLNGETTDISSKDHGIYSATEVNKISWEITSENLYTEGAYGKLFEKMMARQPIQVYFGTKKEMESNKTVADGDYESWSGLSGYTGKVLITSLTANANTGENATYSATFTGTGKIMKAPVIPHLKDMDEPLG